MTAMDHRIEFRENENEKKDEKNSTLKLTIGNMQRSLNRIDSKERSLNVMVSGLPKGKLTVANEELDNDTQKIKCILRHTGNTHFDSEIIDNLNILRVGAEKTGYNRTIKISLNSVHNRDAFLKDVHKLKEAGEPCSVVNMRVNLDKICKKMSLVPLEAQFYVL